MVTHSFKLSGRTTINRSLNQAFIRLGVVFTILTSVLFLQRGEARALPVVIATISVSGADSVVLGVNSIANEVYVGDFDNGIVSKIDGIANTVVATIPGLKVNVNDGPTDIAANSTTNLIYVGRTVHFGGQITVINGATNTASTIGDLGAHPVSLAVNENTNRIYAANQISNNVSVINGATSSVISTIGGFSGPIGVGVNPITNRIYVGNNGTDSISVIDGATNTIVATIPLSADPFRIAVNPTTNRIYVTHASTNTVSVIDGAINSVIATISVGNQPLGIGVNPNTNRIYVANHLSDSLSVIDGNTNTVIYSVTVGSGPAGVAVNPVTSRIYVGNIGSNSMSVIEDVPDATAPVVNVSFSSPDGSNGWFVTSPVVGNVTADDSTTGGSNITTISCSGATVGPITGLGTPNASASLTVSAEGVININCTATDSAGNTGAASGSSNTATVMIDTAVPLVSLNPIADSCSLSGNMGWCRGSQTAGFSANDATSGVASPCAGTSCSFTQSTITNGSAVTIASGAVCDVAGNCNAGIDAGPYMIDSIDPNINITSPTNGGTYLLNAAEASSYNCSDGTSGVATCNGPVADGANFSTSAVGMHNFTVSATDVAGNSAQATNSYSVLYNFTGFFQPVDNLPTLNIATAGKAIPVKFSLSGDQGLDIFASGYPSSTVIACGATAGDAIEQTVTAGSSSLSYDANTDQYTYVWKTEKAWAGTCRTLVVKLNDGTIQRANFKFK
jgi:YVTN family beta-propeller protein